MTEDPSKPVILMIEDADPDFELVERAARRFGLGNGLIRRERLADGAEFLERSATRPWLIILDLRLSDGDGEEFISFLKHSVRYAHIPVVVWSGCNEPETIERCYRDGASGFLRKTSDPLRASDILHQFFNYWFQTATLPNTAS